MQNDNVKFKIEFNKRLIKYSLEMIKFTEKVRKDRNMWSIADQLIRSATSIGANVIEARSSQSKKEYLKYFQIALKSTNETKYWLILIRESCIDFKIVANKLLNEAIEIGKIIGAGVLTMKGNR